MADVDHELEETNGVGRLDSLMLNRAIPLYVGLRRNGSSRGRSPTTTLDTSTGQETAKSYSNVKKTKVFGK